MTPNSSTSSLQDALGLPNAITVSYHPVEEAMQLCAYVYAHLIMNPFLL